MKQFKMLIICGFYEPIINGAVSSLRSLVSNLQIADWEVRVFCAESRNYQFSAMAALPKDAIYSRSFGEFFYESRLQIEPLIQEALDIVDHFQPHIVLTNDLYAALLGSILHESCHLPWLATYHETPQPPRKYIGRILHNPRVELSWSRFVFSALRPDFWLAPSCYFRDWAVQCGAKPDNVILHYFGIDLQRFCIPLTADGLQSDSPVVLSAARIVPRKRIEDLVAAAEIINDRMTIDFQFTWQVQKDFTQYASKIEAAMDSSRHRNRLRRLVSVDDVAIVNYTQQAAASVLVSEIEGLGLSLIEAQACGVPVIGTDVPGIREVVSDGETGLLVPANSPGAVAEAIERVLRDMRLRKRITLAAYAHVRHVFDAKQSANRFCDLCMTLCSPN